MTKKKQKFMRTDFRKYSKLGVRRKNKQKYRKGKGIDNKMRLKMKGHLRNVSIGFRTKKKIRGLVNGLKPVLINNINDLKKIAKEEIGIIAKIGSKKRKDILDYAIKNGIRLSIDAKKALEKIEHKLKKVKEEREKRNVKKIERDKKAKKEAEKKAKQEAKEESKAEKKEEKLKEETTETKKLDTKTESKKEIKSNNYGRGN